MGVKADAIRSATYGIDVREAIAQGVEVSEEANSNYASIQKISKKGATQIIGNLSEIVNNGDNTFTVSWGRLYCFQGSKGLLNKIQIKTNLLIKQNQAAYIDLDAPLVNTDEIEVKLTNESYAFYNSNEFGTSGFWDDNKIILFASMNGIPGGALNSKYNRITNNMLDSYNQNKIARSPMDIIGVVKTWSLNTTTSAITVSWDRLYCFKGAGYLHKIQAVTDLSIPLNQCAYIDLSEAKVNDEYVVHVTTATNAFHNSTDMGSETFYKDNKIILMSNANGIMGGYMSSRMSIDSAKVTWLNNSLQTGKVIFKMPGCAVTWNSTTKTISWNGQLVIPDPVRSQGRIKLDPASYTFTKQYEVCYIDLDAARGYDTAPASVIKGGQYYDSTDSDKYKGNNNQLPIFYYYDDNQYGAIGSFKNLLSVSTTPTPTPSDTPSITVVKVGTTLDIYVPCQKSDRYIQYHYTKVDDDTINMHQWRVLKTYAVDAEFTTVYDFDGQTEWEGAILEQGAADFIGGYHGDENNISLSVMIDGVEIDINGADFTKYAKREVRIVNKSTLNRCNTPNDNVFTRYKVSTWTMDNYTVENRYIALQSFTIDEAKVCLMSMRYTNSSTVGAGAEIISRGRYDYDYLTTDLTTAFSGTGCGIPRTDVKKMELWGLNSGVYVRAQADYDYSKYPNRSQYVADFRSQNRAKIYYDLTGNYTMAAGEELVCKSIYTVMA